MVLSWLFCTYGGETTPASSPVVPGVPPLQRSNYQGPQFECDRSARVMPIEHVNDDYCDCADGSDEPGTSACSGSSTPFWCANVGHKATTIPSSRVRDGICDCCDGSDEVGKTGEGPCHDACAKEAQEAARLREEKAERIQRAKGARLEAMAIGREARAQRQARVDQLTREIAERETTLETVLAQKEHEEELERHERAQQRDEAARQFSIAVLPHLNALPPDHLRDIIVSLCAKDPSVATKLATQALKAPLDGQVTLNHSEVESIAGDLHHLLKPEDREPEEVHYDDDDDDDDEDSGSYEHDDDHYDSEYPSEYDPEYDSEFASEYDHDYDGSEYDQYNPEHNPDHEFVPEDVLAGPREPVSFPHSPIEPIHGIAELAIR